MVTRIFMFRFTEVSVIFSCGKDCKIHIVFAYIFIELRTRHVISCVIKTQIDTKHCFLIKKRLLWASKDMESYLSLKRGQLRRRLGEEYNEKKVSRTVCKTMGSYLRVCIKRWEVESGCALCVGECGVLREAGLLFVLREAWGGMWKGWEAVGKVFRGGQVKYVWQDVDC